MEDAMTLAPSAKVARKERPRHPDRLTVSPETLERLNGWVADLEERLKGISITRNQLVQWLIMSHEAALSAPELRQIEDEFFDELKFAEWAIKELKTAQARGERVSLADIVARSRAAKAEKPRVHTQSKRSRKSPENATADAEKQSHPVMSESAESRISLEKTGVK